jgi:hypothetical protein
MTLIAATPIVELDADLRRAERSERRHFHRCTAVQTGAGLCEDCLVHMDRVITANERLKAARSQIPERHMRVWDPEWLNTQRDDARAAMTDAPEGWAA